MEERELEFAIENRAWTSTWFGGPSLQLPTVNGSLDHVELGKVQRSYCGTTVRPRAGCGSPSSEVPICSITSHALYLLLTFIPRWSEQDLNLGAINRQPFERSSRDITLEDCDVLLPCRLSSSIVKVVDMSLEPWRLLEDNSSRSRRSPREKSLTQCLRDGLDRTWGEQRLWLKKLQVYLDALQRTEEIAHSTPSNADTLLLFVYESARILLQRIENHQFEASSSSIRHIRKQLQVIQEKYRTTQESRIHNIPTEKLPEIFPWSDLDIKEARRVLEHKAAHMRLHNSASQNSVPSVRKDPSRDSLGVRLLGLPIETVETFLSLLTSTELLTIGSLSREWLKRCAPHTWRGARLLNHARSFARLQVLTSFEPIKKAIREITIDIGPPRDPDPPEDGVSDLVHHVIYLRQAYSPSYYYRADCQKERREQLRTLLGVLQIRTLTITYNISIHERDRGGNNFLRSLPHILGVDNICTLETLQLEGPMSALVELGKLPRLKTLRLVPSPSYMKVKRTNAPEEALKHCSLDGSRWGEPDALRLPILHQIPRGCKALTALNLSKVALCLVEFELLSKYVPRLRFLALHGICIGSVEEARVRSCLDFPSGCLVQCGGRWNLHYRGARLPHTVFDFTRVSAQPKEREDEAGGRQACLYALEQMLSRVRGHTILSSEYPRETGFWVVEKNACAFVSRNSLAANLLPWNALPTNAWRDDSSEAIEKIRKLLRSLSSS